MPRTSVPVELVAARGRLDAWRRRRAGRVIPPDLWRQATELGRRHGVHRTATALRLDYYSLRRRVEGGGAGGRRPGRRAAAAARPSSAFVEISPAPAAHECVMEVEDAQGTKLRMQLRGLGARDLARVARSLVGRR